MATLFIERQIRGNSTTTTTETINVQDSRRRQTADCGVRLPAIERPSYDRQTSPDKRKQACCGAANVVDRLIGGESLTSSCPELERGVTVARRDRRRPGRAVKTELPSVDRRQGVVVALSHVHTDPPSSANNCGSSTGRPRRQPPPHQPNSPRPAATEAIYRVDGDLQRPSRTSVDLRAMRRSISDDALPALFQSCHADAPPLVHKPLW